MSSATARFFSLLSTPFPLRHLHHPRHSLLYLSTGRLFPSLSPPPLSSSKLSRRFYFNAQAQNPRDEQFNDFLPPPSTSSPANGAGGSSPWPEWYKLINSSHFSRYSDHVHGNSGFDKFVDDGVGLPADFVRAANACLAFAREHEHRLWSLSRKDIEVVVGNGSPFLFMDAADTMRRMKLFLNAGTDHVLGSDEPSTVDLMKFLLSYTSTTLVSLETNSFNNREIVEASVRRLFSEFSMISGAPESALPGCLPRQFPETNGQPLRSLERNVQMKRGDWICPRCRFMNFARNMRCLECEQLRPKRLLTGGEWECPQCDFFNYGRNLVCLKCDCKKPRTSYPVSGSGYNDYSNNESSHKQLTENQEKAQSWFRKISQLENTSNESSISADEAFSETIPLKDRVISESSTFKQSGNQSPNVKISQSLDKVLSSASSESTSPQYGDAYRTSAAVEDREREQAEKSERWFRRVSELHEIKDLHSAGSDEDYPEIMPMRKGENRFVVRERKDRSLTSLQKRRMAMEQSGSNNYVPFVPFPPNYFAQDKQPVKEESPAGNSSMISSEKLQPNINSEMGFVEHSPDGSRSESLSNQQTSAMSWNQSGAREMGNEKSAIYTRQAQNVADPRINSQGFSSGKYDTSANEPEPSSRATPQPADNQKALGSTRWSSLEGSAVKEPDPLDMSEEAKAERWFRRVAQIKDIKELSEIPDEDFPSIMPMRKGVNRFVVSKRKTPLERRLASSQYRRNLPVVNSNPQKDIDATES